MAEPSNNHAVEDQTVYRAMLDAHIALRGEPSQDEKRYLWAIAQATRANLGLSVEHETPLIDDRVTVKGALLLRRMTTPWQLEQLRGRK